MPSSASFFFNHDTKNVEMESPLIHRVVSALLASQEHELSVQLVQQLLAWQLARLSSSSKWLRGAGVAGLLQSWSVSWMHPVKRSSCCSRA